MWSAAVVFMYLELLYFLILTQSIIFMLTLAVRLKWLKKNKNKQTNTLMTLASIRIFLCW